MRKKVTGLFFSILCIACFMNFNVSAETQSYKYRQMIDMGFLSDDEDADYIVTRGEFAKIICDIKNLSGNATGGLKFDDVAYGDEYYDSICLVSDAGLMVGYQGSFEPNEPLKVSEAVKVFVEAAGYKIVAGAYGGFQNGYMMIAEDIDLFEDISTRSYASPIKRRELGIMLFNLMKAPVSDMSSIEDNRIGFIKDSETFAEKYHDLSYITDVVNANSYTNFSETVASVPEDRIIVGGIQLKIREFKERFLVGRYVSVFYKTESDTIVSVAERVENESVFEVMPYEVLQLSSSSISFETDSRRKTVRIEADTTYVYNDKQIMSYDFTQLSGKNNYHMIFVDNDDDGRCDIVFIEDYYNVPVGDITSDLTAKSKVLYQNTDTGVYESATNVNIDEDISDIIFICDSEYNRLTSENIGNGDVLSVISNAGYTRIMVSRGVISDTINSLQSDGGQYILSCAGSVVYVADGLESYMAETDIVGAKATIYTDIYGNAAYIATGNISDEECGLLIYAGLTDEIGEGAICFKIFGTNQVVSVLYSAERIRINDASFKSSELNALPTAIAGVTDIPVLYKLNEEGAIKEIKLPKTTLDGNADGFFKGSSVSAVTFSYSQKTFGGKIEAGNNTIAFVLPNGTFTASSSVVTGNAIYDTARQYTIDAYYKSKNNDTADIMVIKTDLSVANYNTPVGVITKIGNKALHNEEICDKIEYLSGGTVYSAYINEEKTANPDISALGKGDTIRISVDESGYVRDIVQIYDYDNQNYTLGSNPTNSNFNDSLVIGWGYAVRNSNGRLRVSKDDIAVTDISVFNLQMHVLSGYDIMIVDPEEETIKGNASDINVGDKVVYVLRGGAGKAMVVYK